MSKNYRKKTGGFAICGKNIVCEAMESGRKLSRIFLYRNLGPREKERISLLAGQSGVPVEYRDREDLLRISGTDRNQGIVGILESFSTVEFSEAMETLQEISGPKLVVVLDSINDPQNFGSIIRTASAGNVNLIVTNENRSCPVSETVLRVSEGGAFYVPISVAGNLSQSLKRLKESGFWIYGFEADATGDYYKTDLKGDVALVFGGEGSGLRELTRKSCDMLLRIPIFGKISSLNVAVSAALGIFEVLRQRDTQK
jgi:23S rRNA (guanosine2251-2'-O)-methyltransferase